MKYTKEDAEKFLQEECPKCKCFEHCKETFSDMVEHVKNCPKIFNWKIGFKSFVIENEEYLEQHPEVVEERQKRIKEWLATKRKKKTS